MAETHAKHPREEPESSYFEPSSSKRQKPYNDILISFFEEEESADQALNQDLSAILITLERELSSSSEHSTTTAIFDSLTCTAEEYDELAGGGAEDHEGVESVMRHLLEASDDELGIPNRGDDYTEVNSWENSPFAVTDGLWDLEDEGYSYLTVLQNELLM